MIPASDRAATKWLPLRAAFLYRKNGTGESAGPRSTHANDNNNNIIDDINHNIVILIQGQISPPFSLIYANRHIPPKTTFRPEKHQSLRWWLERHKKGIVIQHSGMRCKDAGQEFVDLWSTPIF
eukprot:GHVU01191593.1.p1 GENE.GHVU01191593.1~~GHVU01191593.1.p1  ORF type:complete len:124 (+),score=9.86 GHVU01191593.1:79-450(+)